MTREFLIQTISENEADGLLAQLYRAALDRAGKVFNIVKCMSLRPRQMRASMGFYRELMFEESGLSRAERELVATVVSQTNACDY